MRLPTGRSIGSEPSSPKFTHAWRGIGVTSSAVIIAVVGVTWLGSERNAVAQQTTCGATGSQGIFSSGFEEGNKAIWDDYDGNPDSTNLLMLDPGPCNRSGNHVMRIRVPAGNGGADLVKILPSQHDKLYARWYQKWEADYDFTALNHGGGLVAGDRSYLGRSDQRPDGTDWFSSWFEPDAGHAATQNGRGKLYSYYRGMYQQCSGQTPGPQAGCWGDSFPTPAERATIQPPQYQPNRWYCLEMMIDAGTPVSSQAQANGSQTFWVDGAQYGPWTNMWFRTSANLKISILWLSLYHHNTHSVGGTMFDDVVVSTTRVGCHGSAQAGPNPPTNLRIIPGV